LIALSARSASSLVLYPTIRVTTESVWGPY
jgi:hypothetical protein